MMLTQYLYDASSITSYSDFSDFTVIKSKALFNDATCNAARFSNRLEIIEHSAFENCKELKCIAFDNKKNFNDYLRDKISSDVKIEKNIGIGANHNALIIQTASFRNCQKLHTVIFPDKKSISIEREAFAGCNNLRTVVFGDGVVDIHEYAFVGCRDLTFVCFGNSKALSYAREHGFRIVNV